MQTKITKETLINIIKEEASEYIWGVKGLGGKIGNIYSLKTEKPALQESQDTLRLPYQPQTLPSGEDALTGAVVAQSLRDMQVPVPPPANKMHALWYQLNLVLNRNMGLDDLKEVMQQISRDPDAVFPEEDEVPPGAGEVSLDPDRLQNHPLPGIYEDKDS
jgi:hypothetical protein